MRMSLPLRLIIPIWETIQEKKRLKMMTPQPLSLKPPLILEIDDLLMVLAKNTLTQSGRYFLKFK